MATLLHGGRFYATDALGAPLAFGKVWTYEAGTSIPKDTFTDQSETVKNSNPVILDGSGKGSIWLGAGAYKIVVTDFNGVQAPDGTIDNLARPTTQVELDELEISLSNSIAAAGGKIVSVKDYGAVGDGTTDDTAAIQQAVATGKHVFFPKPPGFYKVTAAISLGYSPRLSGDAGVSTIIRRTSGSGPVFNFAALNENAVIEHLRIGGAGCVGVQVNGGGYASYLSTAAFRNVHFEADLLTGIDANLIHCDFSGCTFGYFQENGAHASSRHIVSAFDGGTNYSNMNRFENCKFFNCAAAAASVTFNSGLVLTFDSCAWEGNGRDLQCSNMQNVLLLNCYSERGQHATSLFQFLTSRTRTKVVGGQFNGGSLPTGASIFEASLDAPLLVEDADMLTGAAAFAYRKADDGTHKPPATGAHQFKDCRISGNTSDPIKYADGVRSAVVGAKAWAVINTAGSGSVVSSSDPGINLSRNGTGDVNVNFEVVLGSSAALECVVATGQGSYCIATGIGSGQTARVLAFNRATGVAIDDIIMLVVYGK